MCITFIRSILSPLLWIISMNIILKWSERVNDCSRAADVVHFDIHANKPEREGDNGARQGSLVLFLSVLISLLLRLWLSTVELRFINRRRERENNRARGQTLLNLQHPFKIKDISEFIDWSLSFEKVLSSELFSLSQQKFEVWEAQRLKKYPEVKFE